MNSYRLMEKKKDTHDTYMRLWLLKG